MICRRVSADDRERMTSFVDRLPRESEGLDIGKTIFEMREELAGVYLRNMREKKLLEVLVVEEDGRILGVCDLRLERYEDAFAHLAEIGIMVARDAQGRGVGSRLLESMVTRAEELGMDTLIAYVREGNAPSEALFRRGGFTAAGRIPRYFKHRGEYHTGLIFWRDVHGR